MEKSMRKHIKQSNQIKIEKNKKNSAQFSRVEKCLHIEASWNAKFICSKRNISQMQRALRAVIWAIYNGLLEPSSRRSPGHESSDEPWSGIFVNKLHSTMSNKFGLKKIEITTGELQWEEIKSLSTFAGPNLNVARSGRWSGSGAYVRRYSRWRTVMVIRTG
jgi:hypothetical protein